VGLHFASVVQLRSSEIRRLFSAVVFPFPVVSSFHFRVYIAVVLSPEHYIVDSFQSPIFSSLLCSVRRPSVLLLFFSLHSSSLQVAFSVFFLLWPLSRAPSAKVRQYLFSCGNYTGLPFFFCWCLAVSSSCFFVNLVR